MKFPLPLIVLTCCLVGGTAQAVDYKAEALDEAAPGEEFSDSIRAQVGSSAIKVLRGTRTYLELWPAKEWAVKSGFEPSVEVLYPFEPGQFIGIARLKSKGTDFRGQEIAAGLYTVRYGQQPVDGNHVGTAPTRDFFLLLPAGEDQSPETLAKEKLFEMSMDAAGSAHPAIFYLQTAPPDAEGVALDHLDQQEWWVLSFAGNTATGTKLPVSLIVVGQGQE
jgi:hypothetical protein